MNKTTYNIFLSWKKSSAPDVAGYKIYWSIEPNKWHGPVAATTRTSLRLRALRGAIYTFAVTSYDVAGNESPKTILQPVDLR